MEGFADTETDSRMEETLWCAGSIRVHPSRRRRVYPEEPPQVASPRAPPQDEEELCMPLKICLILRSAVRRVSPFETPPGGGSSR